MKKLLAAMFVALLMAGCYRGEIEGQMFIVTTIRTNIKMGAVDITVFDDETIKRLEDKVANSCNKILEGVSIDDKFDKKFKELVRIRMTIIFAQEMAEDVLTIKTDADGRFKFTPPSNRFMLYAQSSRKVGGEEEKYLWNVIFETNEIYDSRVSLDSYNLWTGSTSSIISVSELKEKFNERVAKLNLEKENAAKPKTFEQRMREGSIDAMDSVLESTRGNSQTDTSSRPFFSPAVIICIVIAVFSSLAKLTSSSWAFHLPALFRKRHRPPPPSPQPPPQPSPPPPHLPPPPTRPPPVSEKHKRTRIDE